MFSTPLTLVARDVLDPSDERRELKKRKRQFDAEGAKEYRKANKRVQKALKTAKEDWIDTQCKEIETCLSKNNSKVMDLDSRTTEKNPGL
ncbi:MAG: hypothetical protein AB2693_27315 [Candidatus Thiodiazotropha sp.]